MSSPPQSPSAHHYPRTDSPRLADPNRSVPFPPGVFTFLPQVEACDNVELPTGPWQASDCQARWQQYRYNQQVKKDKKGGVLSATFNSSALDDDEEDEDVDGEGDGEGEGEGDSAASANHNDEFLVPFFLALPKDPSTTVRPSFVSRRSSGASSHRSNGTSSHRPSFSRLTPLPSLRPSSPTSSHPGSFAAPSDPSCTTRAQPIGFLRPQIVKALIADNKKMVAINCKPVWSFSPPVHFPPPARRPSYSTSRPTSRRGSHSLTPMTPGTPTDIPAADGASSSASLKDALEGLRALNVNDPDVASQVYAVGFEDWINNHSAGSNGEDREGDGEDPKEKRREHVDRVMRGWKMSGEFRDVLSGWRDEEYTIYGPSTSSGAEISPLPGSNVAFRMERAACALFGLATFGVHCNGYVPDSDGQPLKIWVPRRAATKQTWPSYLDNTVAGGISAGSTPYSSIVRECAEEASLPASFVENNIKMTSVVVYNYRTTGGWLQPEVQYVYDLEMPRPSGMDGDDVVKPKTNAADGEVESFQLMDVEEVVQRMCDGDFKPNCALVLVDFFLRHGYLTPESDARFIEVATRLRRQMVLPGPA